MMDKVKFQIALGAVKHFGKNLYTSNPPAISELIANSWDAYAKKCQILINENTMYLMDDGIGMTDEELTERYAKSGFEKNENVRRPKDMKLRPFMGKKGIGKFSAFSLTDEYTIITKSEFDKQWKKITLAYDILYSDRVEYEADVELIDDPSLCLFQTIPPLDVPKTSGTIIILPNLKRHINKNTQKSLQDLLAKRFSSSYFDGQYDFKLFFNYGEITEIKLREHFFYSKVEYVYYFNKSKTDIKAMFPSIKDENIVDKSNDYFKKHASGWMGTVEKPTDLKTEDETTVAGVSVYINGKIADENIFKHHVDGRIPNAYLVGEIDLISIDTKDDPVLSSREGLNHELEGVKILKENLSKIRNEILDKWNTMRSSRDISKQDYLSRMMTNPIYKNAYDNYNDKEKSAFKRLAQKVFDKPSEKDEEDIKVLTPAIMQIINDKALNNAAIDLGISEQEILDLFAKLFNVAELNHALRIRSNVMNRLNIIRELEKHIANEEVEKVFEVHLASNPWLINPSWEIKGTKVSSQDKWKYLGIDNNETTIYTDLVVETAQDRFPIIVEIKRSKKTAYSCPNVNEIREQLNKYRVCLSDEINKIEGLNTDLYTYRAIFICGQSEKAKLKTSDFKQLQSDKIELFTYDDLLVQAKTTYSIFDADDYL